MYKSNIAQRLERSKYGGSNFADDLMAMGRHRVKVRAGLRCFDRAERNGSAYSLLAADGGELQRIQRREAMKLKIDEFGFAEVISLTIVDAQLDQFLENYALSVVCRDT